MALNSFLFYFSSTDLVERHRKKEKQRQREKPNLLLPHEHEGYLAFSFLHLTPKKAQSRTVSKPCNHLAICGFECEGTIWRQTKSEWAFTV